MDARRLDVVGLPSGLQHRHMSVEVVGGALRGSVDHGSVQTRHASLASLGSATLSTSEIDELDESALVESQKPMVPQPASG